jgi:hypothetical protein
MKFIKIGLLVLFCIMALLGGLFLWLIFPRDQPITLSFLGYRLASNNLQVASFSMSNHSSRPVAYLADGPSAPHYYLTRQLFHDRNTGVIAVTNYNMWFSSYATQLTLPPNGTVTFVVPITAGITDVTVGVQYLPNRRPLHQLSRDVASSLTGGPSERYRNVELKAPFK